MCLNDRFRKRWLELRFHKKLDQEGRLINKILDYIETRAYWKKSFGTFGNEMIIEIALGFFLGGILLVILLPFLGLLISIGIFVAILIAILIGGVVFFEIIYWDFFDLELGVSILIILGVLGIVLFILECRRSKDWRIRAIPATIYLLIILGCIVGIVANTVLEMNLKAFGTGVILSLIPFSLYGIWLRCLYKQKYETVTS